MPDEQNPGGMPNTTDGGDAGGQNPNNETPSADDYQKQLAEAQAHIKKLNAESAQRRKALEAYEADEEKRKEAELSELEKRDKRIEKMQADNAALQQRYETTLIRAAVTSTAHALGFRDPDVAMKLLPEGAVTISEDGKIDGAEAALKALAKDHEYLLNPVNTKDKDAGKKTKQGDKQTSLEQIARKYGI